MQIGGPGGTAVASPAPVASSSPGAAPLPSVSPRASLSTPSRFTNEKDKQSFYRWLAHEMVVQVYAKKPKDSSEIDSWVNVLSQDGSIEGIYHGMVLSTEYSNAEHGVASDQAVKFFVTEMALLNQGLVEPDASTPKVMADIAAKAQGMSLFTLKRILGERVLKEIDTRKVDQEKFSDWYARIVIRWNGMGVPLGLPERSNSDRAYHKNWALTNPIGLVQWELLNRIHRILNQFGGITLDDK